MDKKHFKRKSNSNLKPSKVEANLSEARKPKRSMDREKK